MEQATYPSAANPQQDKAFPLLNPATTRPNTLDQGLDDPDDVAPFVQARSTLRQTALEPDDSLELISTYARRHEREG